MPRLPVSDDEITVPEAAKLLGLVPRTVRDMINRGELHAEVDRPADLPKHRRAIRLRRRDVDDFLERARVRPGELTHLHDERATGL